MTSSFVSVQTSEPLHRPALAERRPPPPSQPRDVGERLNGNVDVAFVTVCYVDNWASGVLAAHRESPERFVGECWRLPTFGLHAQRVDLLEQRCFARGFERIFAAWRIRPFLQSFIDSRRASDTAARVVLLGPIEARARHEAEKVWPRLYWLFILHNRFSIRKCRKWQCNGDDFARRRKAIWQPYLTGWMRTNSKGNTM